MLSITSFRNIFEELVIEASEILEGFEKLRHFDELSKDARLNALKNVFV